MPAAGAPAQASKALHSRMHSRMHSQMWMARRSGTQQTIMDELVTLATILPETTSTGAAVGFSYGIVAGISVSAAGLLLLLLVFFESTVPRTIVGSFAALSLTVALAAGVAYGLVRWRGGSASAAALLPPGFSIAPLRPSPPRTSFRTSCPLPARRFCR
jgi:hypothetical protein